MSLQAVLLPLFVEVILTFILWGWMATLRTREMTSGGVRPEDIALREPGWSKEVRGGRTTVTVWLPRDDSAGIHNTRLRPV